jgi:HSP20 family molecular chaperone IbpA
MELVFENGWNGNSVMLDRLNSFRRDTEEATGGHMHPRADVIEDNAAYHFYFDMPGLKGESVDVQVEDDQLTVAADRKEGPSGRMKARSISQSEATVLLDAHSSFRITRAVMARGAGHHSFPKPTAPLDET